VTLAKERPNVSVVATDLSMDACSVAEENAKRLEVTDRVDVREGDLFLALSSEHPFDALVANPPYIATGEIDALSPEVRQEPRTALDGGPRGLSLINRIVEGARPWLRPGGLLALEIGETQGSEVLALLDAHGFTDPRIERDLERRDRFAFAIG
jgi:release factor glutamine methyltransferase